MKNKKNFVFMLIILVLLILPFLVTQGEFGGADQIALEVVREIDPNYQPIAQNIMKPASGEIESMLFTLQGVIGACFIGYFIGSKYKSKNSAG